jgi:hypothetical protein
MRTRPLAIETNQGNPGSNWWSHCLAKPNRAYQAIARSACSTRRTGTTSSSTKSDYFPHPCPSFSGLPVYAIQHRAELSQKKSHLSSHGPNRHHRTNSTSPDIGCRKSRMKPTPPGQSNGWIPSHNPSWVRSPPALPRGKYVDFEASVVLNRIVGEGRDHHLICPSPLRLGNRCEREPAHVAHVTATSVLRRFSWPLTPPVSVLGITPECCAQ